MNSNLRIVKELEKIYDPFEFLKSYGIKFMLYEDRMVLNYDQIDSHSHRHIDFVKECRGLILEWPSYNVLCRSFDRFFNYGEDPRSNKFNIGKSICMEKIDGSLLNVYHDGKEWQCATRGMAFAEGETRHPEYTFRKIFMEAINSTNLNETFKDFNKDFTYIFEVVSSITRVVKLYPGINTYALAIRNKYDGSWIPTVEAIDYITSAIPTVLKPSIHTFENLDSIMENFKDLPAFDEGYVCMIEDDETKSVWRVKVKNPSYLAIAHIRQDGNLSEKSIVKLVFTNDHEEYLSMFPEDRKFFNPYIGAFNRMMKEVDNLYSRVEHIIDQKEYALKVKNHGCCGILFMMKKGKTLSEIFDRMTVNGKVEIVKKYMKEKDK